jgi:phage terminase small subunit
MTDDNDLPQPPEHLRESTRKWVANVLEDFDLEEHHTKLLFLAAESWDRGAMAREALAQHGLTYLDRFGAPHARPEIAIERDSRIAFARLLRELALDVSEPEESRPPSIVGKSALRAREA